MRVSMVRYATVLLLAGCSGGGGSAVSAVLPACGSSGGSSALALLWPQIGTTGVATTAGAIYFAFASASPGSPVSFNVVLTSGTAPSLTAGTASVTTTLPPGALSGSSELNPCVVNALIGNCTSGGADTVTDFMAPIGPLAAQTAYAVTITAAVREASCVETDTIKEGTFRTS
jgi:hypothetical protein